LPKKWQSATRKADHKKREKKRGRSLAACVTLVNQWSFERLLIQRNSDLSIFTKKTGLVSATLQHLHNKK
jgi:hypothetical protein